MLNWKSKKCFPTRNNFPNEFVGRFILPQTKFFSSLLSTILKWKNVGTNVLITAICYKKVFVKKKKMETEKKQIKWFAGLQIISSIKSFLLVKICRMFKFSIYLTQLLKSHIKLFQLEIIEVNKKLFYTSPISNINFDCIANPYRMFNSTIFRKTFLEICLPAKKCVRYTALYRFYSPEQSFLKLQTPAWK